MRVLTWILTGLILAAPSLAAGADAVKYSGTVVSVDQAAGVLVLATLEEGRRDGGPTPVTGVRVALTPSTAIVEARRAPGARPDGEFVDSPVPLSRLTPGDFVTVESVRDGKRLVARTVTVVAPGPR
ncbi:MAG TPA: hypothetical protein VGR82_09840 [Methylomirabilota bacterium]|nr:hypothetical protein [Methylomirabilota bacterium]